MAQTDVLTELEAFAPQIKDRMQFNGHYIDFKIGASMLIGYPGAIALYLAAVIIVSQGVMLYMLTGTIDPYLLLIVIAVASCAIAIGSFGARIDLFNQKAQRLFLGFPVRTLAFSDFRNILTTNYSFLNLQNGVNFQLVGKNGRRVNLVTFRKKENAERFKRMLPALLKLKLSR